MNKLLLGLSILLSIALLSGCGSGSKGTLSAAKSSKFKNPYAFGANENLCQGYCDGEKACKAIHWERAEGEKLSRCYLRGGPVDPTKFKGAKAPSAGAEEKERNKGER